MSRRQSGGGGGGGVGLIELVGDLGEGTGGVHIYGAYETEVGGGICEGICWWSGGLVCMGTWDQVALKLSTLELTEKLGLKCRPAGNIYIYKRHGRRSINRELLIQGS